MNKWIVQVPLGRSYGTALSSSMKKSHERCFYFWALHFGSMTGHPENRVGKLFSCTFLNIDASNVFILYIKGSNAQCNLFHPCTTVPTCQSSFYSEKFWCNEQ